MRIGLIIETLHPPGAGADHLARGSRSVIFFVFGAHAFIWGTTSITVRQRAVPTELQGRVGSVNTGRRLRRAGRRLRRSAACSRQHCGVTAPFWFAFAGSARLRGADLAPAAHIAHADEPRPTPEVVG